MPINSGLLVWVNSFPRINVTGCFIGFPRINVTGRCFRLPPHYRLLTPGGYFIKTVIGRLYVWPIVMINYDDVCLVQAYRYKLKLSRNAYYLHDIGCLAKKTRFNGLLIKQQYTSSLKNNANIVKMTQCVLTVGYATWFIHW